MSLKNLDSHQLSVNNATLFALERILIFSKLCTPQQQRCPSLNTKMLINRDMVFEHADGFFSPFHRYFNVKFCLALTRVKSTLYEQFI